jgi:lipid-A-disaccharide synthase
MNTPGIMFIAGDPSGDIHASHVVRRLREERPALDLYGIGGPAMASAGLTQLMPFEPFACMGVWEVLRQLPFFLAARRTLTRALAERRPDALVLVDYAGFNIPMMKAAHRLGIPVVWYIAPKVWAWKRRRAAVLGRHCAAIATIFPFEKSYFDGFGARVAFVGNPLMESLASDSRPPRPQYAVPKPGVFFKIALVPGSRRQELEQTLLPMIAAFNILRRNFRQIRATVSCVPWLPKALYADQAEASGVDLFDGPLPELLAGSDLALVTSGTATLETALCGVPHVIVYKTSALTYRLFKLFVKVPFIGLPNIVAGSQVVPELMQDEMQPVKMAAELERYIADRAYYQQTQTRLTALSEELGSRKPSEEVARMVLETARIT